ncbi:sugar-transfer associated ATP-grasp domain-containing protein [Dongia soli]|uniref:Sugar-transfer associated ATP-grasp domain-containing protein n=1 Tax=Dongia soli TaxID=600628 RepID=A0ABU5EDI9_9PROT|nr:sugar-transfer associated ATP-grasp domain-containing protein [Dongia soli]MDY0884115.1 sugar-transfer associated ATP-grasp domain-containing protein [Dongia soli]
MPIDLKTGVLGPLTGDQGYMLVSHMERHPATGCQVSGRHLPFWNEMVQLAKRTHQAFAGRAIMMTDMICTENGPCIIDLDTRVDIDVLQATYQQPIAKSELGKQMLNYLETMAEPLRLD